MNKFLAWSLLCAIGCLWKLTGADGKILRLRFFDVSIHRYEGDKAGFPNVGVEVIWKSEMAAPSAPALPMRSMAMIYSLFFKRRSMGNPAIDCWS